MISDERLAVIAAHGRESIFPVTPGDCSEMARELLALRKATGTPIAYMRETVDVKASSYCAFIRTIKLACCSELDIGAFPVYRIDWPE